MRKEVFIGLTYGDPAGIGPEILSKALNNWKFKLKPIIFGSATYLNSNKLNIKNNIKFYASNKLTNLKNNLKLGRPSKFTGIYSYECLRSAVEYAKRCKKNFALVTGPVSKTAISAAGIKFSGQTDEIAKFLNINPDSVIMLFVVSDLRIALFTRHIPLKEVHSKLTKHALIKYILILNKELKKWFHIKNPKIAVLGLNPHAGEGGLFGYEEKKIILPAIKYLKKHNINISGPFSPDSALANAGRCYLCKKKQPYDVYVSFYHDQCLPMFKATAGYKGLNVSLGLPFIRVSPDHGTAFDIAGKDKASSESYMCAIKFLEDLL